MKRTSTKPKGATSYKQTAFGIIPRSKLLLLELEGTKRGLDYISKNYSQTITPDLILSIHHIAFGWIFLEWAGKFRTIRVEFSGKEAVQPNQVPLLITNLCADLEERIKHLESNSDEYIHKVVELLAWVQHGFVLIHPFQDYNGRLARMLTICILLKLNLPPIEIKVDNDEDRQRYLNAMYAADAGNYSKLEKLIEAALNESLSKINEV
ncbi:MAG: Fic family protein [bacterium]